MNPPRFTRITPHIYRLNLRWWVFAVSVWLVAHEDQWVLIDAGPPGSAGRIIEAVDHLAGAIPQTIIVTHGHLDHVGSLTEVARHYQSQVWAHRLEVPYILGTAKYAEISASNRLYRALSPRLPSHALGIEISRALNDSDECYGMRIVHVPGHAPGMIALLHHGDRALLAADTFRFKPFTAMPILTYDRKLARRSMQTLAALDFDHLLPSHNRPYLRDGKQRAVKAAR